MHVKIQGRDKEAMTKKYEYQCWIDIDGRLRIIDRILQLKMRKL